MKGENSVNAVDRKELFIQMAVEFELPAKQLANSLDGLGFFVAPASTKYHGNYPGGLFDHCHTMTKELIELTANNQLQWQRDISPFIVGMFHDLCKCDKYRHPVIAGTLGGVPITDSKKWEYADGSPWGDGHGSKSVAVASTLIQLTPEEVMCILHHMGAYEKDAWQNYDAAIRRYPNVLWTHHADMIASKIHGI